MYNRVSANRRGLNTQFLNGVDEFVRLAKELPYYLSEKKIRCPCVKCKCMRLLTEYEVKHHLYKDGFKPEYWIRTEHGEDEPESSHLGRQSSHVNWDEDDQFDMMEHMVTDVFRPILDQIAHEDEEPNPECQRFYNMLMDANKPIYETCSKATLSISVKLLAAKFNSHIP